MHTNIDFWSKVCPSEADRIIGEMRKSYNDAMVVLFPHFIFVGRGVRFIAVLLSGEYPSGPSYCAVAFLSFCRIWNQPRTEQQKNVSAGNRHDRLGIKFERHELLAMAPVHIADDSWKI